jgi:hypothetical protein
MGVPCQAIGLNRVDHERFRGRLKTARSRSYTDGPWGYSVPGIAILPGRYTLYREYQYDPALPAPALTPW